MKKSVKKGLIATALLGVVVAPCTMCLAGCGMESQAQVSTYEELVEALKGDKSVVRLTEDIDLQDQVVVNRKVKLDLNGKTISNSNDIWDQANSKLSLIASGQNGDLTITGNGVISAKQDDCYGVDVRYGGKMVIENGEIIGNVTSVYSYEGDIEIKGGTYSIKQKSNTNGYKLTINLNDANRDAGTANLKIYGGTFKNFDPANTIEENYSLLPEGYQSSLVEGSTTDYVVTRIA